MVALLEGKKLVYVKLILREEKSILNEISCGVDAGQLINSLKLFAL